jgi:hypothetical protein
VLMRQESDSVCVRGETGSAGTDNRWHHQRRSSCTRKPTGEPWHGSTACVRDAQSRAPIHRGNCANGALLCVVVVAVARTKIERRRAFRQQVQMHPGRRHSVPPTAHCQCPCCPSLCEKRKPPLIDKMRSSATPGCSARAERRVASVDNGTALWWCQILLSTPRRRRHRLRLQSRRASSVCQNGMQREFQSLWKTSTCRRKTDRGRKAGFFPPK